MVVRRIELILNIKIWIFTGRREAVIKSSEAVALSYYPCPPLVQPHHALFVPAIFSSLCSFQDMPINLSARWVDILVSLWWPPLGPLCCLVCGQAHGLLSLSASAFLSQSSHCLRVCNVYAFHFFHPCCEPSVTF